MIVIVIVNMRKIVKKINKNFKTYYLRGTERESYLFVVLAA